MSTVSWRDLLLGVAAIPFCYYAIALFSVVRFFITNRRSTAAATEFTPPISNLKPLRGLDPDAYENLASFCRQDYPQYEILFCVGDTTDPVLPVLQRLVRDFPERQIRILVGTERVAANDKVLKLDRMVHEAAYEHLVISDSDVRVDAKYLRDIIRPMADPAVGAVTCFYVPVSETTWVQRLQDIGMLSDFYVGILVAKQLDGVKFALGPTIATTRSHLQAFGGYAAIENRPADDLLVGRLIAEQGSEVVLLNYNIRTVADFSSLSELFHKRLRWMTVMRKLRPWGHAGLIFTLGLPWALLAIALRPTAGVAACYLGGYLLVRFALTLLVGEWGLHQPRVWAKLLYVPLWDAMATLIWLGSFTRRTIRWRGQDYQIRGGELFPLATNADGARAAGEAAS